MKFDTPPIRFKTPQFDLRPLQFDLGPLQFDLRPLQFDLRPLQFNSRPLQLRSLSAYQKFSWITGTEPPHLLTNSNELSNVPIRFQLSVPTEFPQRKPSQSQFAFCVLRVAFCVIGFGLQKMESFWISRYLPHFTATGFDSNSA